MKKIVLDFEKALVGAKALDLAGGILGEHLILGLDGYMVGMRERFIKGLKEYRNIDLDCTVGECILNDGKFHWGDRNDDDPNRVLVMEFTELLKVFGVNPKIADFSKLHPAVKYMQMPGFLSIAYMFEENKISVNMIRMQVDSDTMKKISDDIARLAKPSQ